MWRDNARPESSSDSGHAVHIAAREEEPGGFRHGPTHLQRQTDQESRHGCQQQEMQQRRGRAIYFPCFGTTSYENVPALTKFGHFFCIAYLSILRRPNRFVYHQCRAILPHDYFPAFPPVIINGEVGKDCILGVLTSHRE